MKTDVKIYKNKQKTSQKYLKICLILKNKNKKFTKFQKHANMAYLRLSAYLPLSKKFTQF